MCHVGRAHTIETCSRPRHGRRRRRRTLHARRRQHADNKTLSCRSCLHPPVRDHRESASHSHTCTHTHTPHHTCSRHVAPPVHATDKQYRLGPFPVRRLLPGHSRRHCCCNTLLSTSRSIRRPPPPPPPPFLQWTRRSAVVPRTNGTATSTRPQLSQSTGINVS